MSYIVSGLSGEMVTADQLLGKEETEEEQIAARQTKIQAAERQLEELQRRQREGN